MLARHLAAASLLASLVVGAMGCHAEARINTGDDDTRSRHDEPEPVSSPAAPVTAPAPTAPPTDACPLLCYEARGSVRAEMTAEETTQLRSSLEPVMSRMRQCTTNDDWRRYGSPTINLRIAPDGTLAEMGVDPSHGHSNSCFDDIGRSGNATLALPGRKVVRCAERCIRETRETPRRRNRGR